MTVTMFAGSQTLPTTLPPASGHIYGWVDTSVPGHRELSLGGGSTVNATIPSGYYRGDELATELTGQSIPTTFADGLFTVTAPVANTLISEDRLAAIMGLAARAGQTMPVLATWTSGRISPVAIPLLGAIWTRVTVDADDVLAMSRQQRASGYAWGAVRVWDVELLMHRWAFEAFEFGWCSKGKVSIVCGSDVAMSSSVTGGKIEGQVLSVTRPVWSSTVELQATVTLRIAEVA
jgi:hypothetical protein